MSKIEKFVFIDSKNRNNCYTSIFVYLEWLTEDHKRKNKNYYEDCFWSRRNR